MKVLLAHPGTQYSFRLAMELQRKAVLSAFHTGVAFCADGWADKVWGKLPVRWQRLVANRRVEDVTSKQLYCYPIGELYALWQLYNGGAPQSIIHRRNEKFQRGIPDSAISSVQAVIGFDTSSWILADRCAQYDVPLILDQSTWHPDAKLRVYELVKNRFPEWVVEAEHRLTEVRVAEEKEYMNAKLIVAASSFTRKSLIDNGVPPSKVRVNPYGVDCGKFSLSGREDSRRFRFAFVGAINAFKGVPLLLEAWRQLAVQSAELWLVGSASRFVLERMPKLPGLRCVGGVPHGEISEVLKQCNVLVFPSYFEGFGLVILEAMASGLPVLTTTATAGQDIITHAKDGWVIDPDDLDRLVEIMDYCLSFPKTIREMGRSARSTAERFTWTAYGQRWMEILTSSQQS